MLWIKCKSCLFCDNDSLTVFYHKYVISFQWIVISQAIKDAHLQAYKVYYGNYVQQEETHVHIYEETDGMPKKKIYDISRLHGIKKFIFISIFAVVTIMQLRLFCYPQSDCWTDEEISGLVFCSYRKYGYKWTYGRYDSMSIHQYPYYHTYLLCESTEMGYGYFERFLNMLLDNLYYRPM